MFEIPSVLNSAQLKWFCFCFCALFLVELINDIVLFTCQTKLYCLSLLSINTQKRQKKYNIVISSKTAENIPNNTLTKSKNNEILCYMMQKFGYL